MSIVRRTLAVAGTTAALAVLAPAAAHATQVGWGGTLLPGGTQCLSRTATGANYQVRVEGTADRMGARFRFLFNGGVLDATSTDTVVSYNAERRTSQHNYPGQGVYQLCAANHAASNTLVNLHILFDNEFI